MFVQRNPIRRFLSALSSVGEASRGRVAGSTMTHRRVNDSYGEAPEAPAERSVARRQRSE